MMKRLESVLKKENANYIFPFLWLHGEDEATLREYMQVIHDANIGAVCIESRPHPDFLGDKWWADLDVIIEEAKRLGMRVWILDDSHFPTGFANGAVKNAPKELHHKYLCYRTLQIAGPIKRVEFSLEEYMQPVPLPPWMPALPKNEDDFADDRLVKILACPVLKNEELGTPIDLTDKVKGDNVVFDLPEGFFKIFVTYITRNGKGRNDYINFLDKKSCQILIDTVYESHYAHYREEFGKTIAGFFSDEPPIGNVDGYMPVGPIGEPNQDLPWSDAAMKCLSEEFGSEGWKELIPYLWAPAQDKGKQAKVRGAYMQMVTKLVEECFSMQNGKWCEEHGVEYIGHMLEDCDMNMNLGASMGHFFRGLAGQHMAGIDNIGGQVAINGQNYGRHDQPACQDEAGFYQYVLGKLGASHGAIDPKKKGRTMCENFGAYGWKYGPTEQKYMMDHFMVRGVNRYVPHAFSPAPFPDPDCPPHFYAHGENPTYRAFGELMGYSSRVCHLIDGGKSCPDVAVLYAAESIWAGDGQSNIPVCRSLGQAQVDFHIIPADVFEKDGEYPFQFDGQIMRVNNVEYRALVISGCTYLEGNVAKFIADAVKKEFPIIFTDCKPEGIVAGTADENEAFTETIKECVLVPAEKIGTYLKENNVISLQTLMKPDDRMLTVYHYILEETDEFFVLNEKNSQIYAGEAIVKASGIPVRYYPWENRLEKVEYETLPDKFTRIRLVVDPLELCVIVFVKNEKELNDLNHISKITAFKDLDERLIASIDEFEVGHVDSRDYLNQLKKAGVTVHCKHTMVKKTGSEQVKAPYTGMQKMYPEYSGYYVYDAQLFLEQGKDYELRIDEVHETAEVFINGNSLGMKVQRPYTYTIPARFVQEKNEIRIEVATTLERKVKAIGGELWAMSAPGPLSPTGIVGNVKIYTK